jgi:hypothetical protein
MSRLPTRNPYACTPADEAENWNITNQQFVTIEETLVTLATGGEKVKSTVVDTTAEYLHDAIADVATYDSSTDPLVKAATIDKGSGNLAERLFVDASGITGYTTSGTVVLALVSGVIQWTASGGSDAFTVMITAGDTTPSYLHDAVNDNGTYESGEDLLVKSETVGSGGTNQKERLFVESDAISGWDGALRDQELCHEGGTTKWAPRIILVEITGEISARSGTTLGSGSAQPVDPDALGTDIGGTITVYNVSTEKFNTIAGTFYTAAVKIGTKYFIGNVFDLKTLAGAANSKILWINGSGVVRFDAETC